MQTAATMISDMKALLTLLLLKTGMSSAEIRTSLQLSATSRAMAAEGQTYGNPAATQPLPANNIAKLYPNSEAEIAARNAALAIESMNSDVMALITLSLLKIGVSSDEIRKALRLAANSRAPAADKAKGTPATALLELSDPTGGSAALASKQALLNELLIHNASQAAAM